jgi:Cof subfamily protein (haloacid dehalogenase superfamily)
MIKAVFFDIDGTLVSHTNHRIPDSTQLALITLKKQGIKLFVATGRAPNEIAFLKKLTNVEFDGNITMNDQYCYMGNRVIHEQHIEQSDLMGLAEYLKHNDVTCDFFELNYLYRNRNTSASKQVQQLLGNTVSNLPIENIDRALMHCVYQLSVYIPESEETALFRHLPHCKAARWNSLYTDIIPKTGGKTVGMEKLLNAYGLTVEESMAFGDGGNDMAMLQLAGIGVAMGNAPANVKQVANYVTADVDRYHGRIAPLQNS